MRWPGKRTPGPAPVSDHRSERRATRVATEERLREDDELRSLGARLARDRSHTLDCVGRAGGRPNLGDRDEKSAHPREDMQLMKRLVGLPSSVRYIGNT